MNILFLTQVLPYPMDAGPKTRAYLVLRHLVESGHKVVMVSFIRDDDRPEYLDHLRCYCEDIHTVTLRRSRIKDGMSLIRALIMGKPFLIARDYFPSMARVIRNVVHSLPSLDAIHADQLWMAPYALLASKCCYKTHSPLTVLDQHNAVFNLPRRLTATENNPWKRILLKIEAHKLARYEQNVCRQFDRIVWVTDKDREALEALDGHSSIISASQTVIPIALDLATCALICRRENPHRITFIGGLHWPPNAQGILWFRKEIWPLIKEKVPGVVLTIIGKNPSGSVVNGSDPDIEVTGYLSDPTRYLAETSVFIVPLLAGGGMRVKILDAWSWGLPVVSTSIGAEGLYARHAENLYLADHPDSFASAVIRMLKNPQIAARLAVEGRRTLESYYDWRKAYRAWDEIYPCES